MALVKEEIKVCVASEEVAKEYAKYELEKKGIQDFQIDSTTLTDIEGNIGYNIQVSYHKLGEQDTQMNLEEIKLIREEAKSLQQELVDLEKKKEEISEELKGIQDKCNHEIIVQLKTYDPASIYNPSCCLICNQHFNDQFIHYDRRNKGMPAYTIHFENLLNIPEEKKVQIAFQVFEELREEHPELSDGEIVQMINEQIVEAKNVAEKKSRSK